MGEFSKQNKKTDASPFFIDTLPAGNLRTASRAQLLWIRKKEKQYLLLNAFLSVAVVLLAFWENNEYHATEDEDSSMILALRTLLVSLTGLQVAIVAQTYCLYTKELRETRDNQTKLTAWLVVEAALTCPVVVPFYDFTVELTQLGRKMSLTLDDILMPMVCLRLVHTIKCLQFLSFISHPRSYCYSALHAVPSHFSFLLKGLLASKLFTLTTLILLSNMCLSGLLLRVFEQNLSSRPEMDSVWNGLWLAEVSNHTIGYGEFVPLTHIGRGVVAMSVLVGIGTLSFIVVWASNKLTLEDQELRMFAAILTKKMASGRLRVKAAILVQRACRLFLKRNKAESRLREVSEFYFQVRKFRFERSLCKATSEPTLKVQLYYFDSDTRPRFEAITSSVHAVRQYDDVVSFT